MSSSKNRRSVAPSGRRRYDDESGLSRTRPQKPKRQPPPPSSESEGPTGSDSDLESELDMPARDDTRRPRKAPPPARKGRLDGRNKVIKGEEDDGEALSAEKARETGAKVAPHMQLLLGATYHLGLNVIQQPAISSFLPFIGNLFQTVYVICDLISENTLLHEFCPWFFSPVLYLYYAHAVYYHLLRVRAAAGSDVLTRIEQRVLKFYERVGPAESWPIAAPLLGFFHHLGAHKTENPMFSWIVPALPDFSVLVGANNTDNGLASLHNLVGGQRFPCVPALQQLVYNFAHNVGDWNADGVYRPLGNDNIDATHPFCGFTSSTATNNAFQSLAWNTCWLAPIESGNEFGLIDLTVKRNVIHRWNVPPVLENANLSSLQNFLGFTDGVSFDWMRRLLVTSSQVNRFFPGSSNLSSVPPLTTIGMATKVYYRRQNAAAAADHEWFHPRESWSIVKLYGYSSTEQGLVDTRAAVTVSPNASLSESVAPAAGRQIGVERTGPFFNNGIYPELSESPLTESGAQQDPTTRLHELISQLYDNKGGRA